MVGVPRIYEKIRSAVITQSPANGIQGRIARWAFAVGRESRPYRSVSYTHLRIMPRFDSTSSLSWGKSLDSPGPTLSSCPAPVITSSEIVLSALRP